MRKSLVIGIGAAVAGASGLLWLGSFRWRRATARLAARLRRAAHVQAGLVPVPGELDRLPPPVARYFRAALPPEGHRAVRYARLVQRGDFLARPGPDGWRPFRAVEHFTAAPPGFVWDARIRMGPGVHVLVRDGFIEGRGTMTASLAGLRRVVQVEGTPAVASGALLRYLAEAVWLPTALLPSQGVSWTPIDAHAARATITAGGTTVSLDFRFGPDGLVAGTYAAARERDLGDGRSEPTPWQGRFSRPARRDGMMIPLAGEVEWVLPDGAQPYWRGEIVEAHYE